MDVNYSRMQCRGRWLETKRKEVKGDLRIFFSDDVRDFFFLPNIIRVMTSRGEGERLGMWHECGEFHGRFFHKPFNFSEFYPSPT